MAESTPATAKDASSGAKNEPATPDDPPPYPYLRLLHQLQSKAVRAQDPAAAAAAAPAADDDNQEGKFESLSDILQSEQRRAEAEPWDLSADALLATLLHEFSSHVARRSHSAASEIRDLQDAVNRAGVDVAVRQTEFLRRSGDFFMEQVVEDDESESDSEGDDVDGDEDGDGEAAAESATPTDGPNLRGNDDGSDDSSADIARLEAEERSAIAAGMKALELFYDPKRPGKNSSGGGSGSGGSGEGEAADAEEDIIGDNCYYYPAAEGDGFNQRPLPFIIGSREFMESSCAGLGG